MSIYIFGDSFSCRYDNCYYDGEIGDLWYDIIERKLKTKVINKSEGGKGPYSAFKIFYETVEKNKLTSDDKIIFMLSSKYRIPFPFLKDNQLGEDHIDTFISNGKLEEDVKEFIENHSYDIMMNYSTFKHEIDRFNVKNLYFLKSFSQLKEIRTMCFLCFENFDFDIYDFQKLNDNFFRVHHEVLWDITAKENTTMNPWVDTIDNQRANHLSYSNHKILSNIIINFFESKNLTERFHKNIFTKHKSENFLYE